MASLVAKINKDHANLQTQELNTSNYGYLKEMLIEEILEEVNVQLSYCVERQRILCKFDDDTDWRMICDWRDHGITHTILFPRITLKINLHTFKQCVIYFEGCLRICNSTANLCSIHVKTKYFHSNLKNTILGIVGKCDWYQLDKEDVTKVVDAINAEVEKRISVIHTDNYLVLCDNDHGFGASSNLNDRKSSVTLCENFFGKYLLEFKIHVILITDLYKFMTSN